MKIAFAFAFALSVAACGGTSKPSTPPDPPPPVTDVAKLGAPCGEAGLCEAGTCAKYFGIAGPSGPEFSSCEISCAEPTALCPDGSACTTIADGPGAVCRPPSVDAVEEAPAAE